MPDAVLDISALEKAFVQLRESHGAALRVQGGDEKHYYPFFRAASIQAYEYTYELCIKMVQRYIEMYGARDEALITQRFTDIMRIAAEYGLLQNPLEWEEFRKWRSITAHTYDEKKADMVFSHIANFLISAEDLLVSLREKIHASH